MLATRLRDKIKRHVKAKAASQAYLNEERQMHIDIAKEARRQKLRNERLAPHAAQHEVGTRQAVYDLEQDALKQKARHEAEERTAQREQARLHQQEQLAIQQHQATLRAAQEAEAREVARQQEADTKAAQREAARLALQVEQHQATLRAQKEAEAREVVRAAEAEARTAQRGISRDTAQKGMLDKLGNIITSEIVKLAPQAPPPPPPPPPPPQPQPQPPVPAPSSEEEEEEEEEGPVEWKLQRDKLDGKKIADTISDMKKDRKITANVVKAYLTSKGVSFTDRDTKEVLFRKIEESVEPARAFIKGQAKEGSVKSSASAAVGPAKNTRSQAAVDTGQSFMSKASDPAGTGLLGLSRKGVVGGVPPSRKRLVRFK